MDKYPADQFQRQSRSDGEENTRRLVEEYPLLVRVNGQEDEFFAVGGGFVEVRPDKVVLVARSGESVSEIDAERAERAMHEAEAYLSSPERDRDKERSMTMAAALRRSRVRLNIYRRRGRGPRRSGDRPSVPPQAEQEESS